MATRLLIGADPAAPVYEFTRSDIKSRSLQIVTSVDVVGAELAADELYCDVDYMTGEYVWFSPADYDGVMTSDGYIFAAADQTADLTQVPFATPMWLMDGTAVRHKLYFDNAERIDPQTYRLTAISGVGILERRRHKGNYYAGETVTAVLAEIIGDAFPYTVANDVAAQRVYGLLLPDTARRNLHMLMFALGIALTKDASGGIQFIFLTDTVAGTIPTSRVFLGGSVSFQTPVTAVEVTEHTFYQAAAAEPAVIWDSGANPAADHTLVEFDNAYFDLTASDGLVIEESGATYAVISGIGVLAGLPYAHDTRVVRLDNPDPAGAQNVIKSDQDFLVNSVNSLSVARRLLSYYTAPKVVQLPAKLDGEKAGQNVNYPDPFGGGQETGFIIGADTIVTGFEKASLKILTDYSPTGQGNYYEHGVTISTSGSWTVPAGVTRIRIVLIGGGAGGQGGMKGADGHGGSSGWGGDMTSVEGGWRYSRWYYSSQGETPGGDPGDPGAAGNVYVEDLDVSPGQTISVAVGSGGAGGAADGGSGSQGTPTTAAIGGRSLTSEDGLNTSAFADLFSGNVYASPGAPGHPGGAGGLTDAIALTGDRGAAGLAGGAVASKTGGSGGSGLSEEFPAVDYLALPGSAHNNLTQNDITGTWDSNNEYITISGTATGPWENKLFPSGTGTIPCSEGNIIYFRGANIGSSIRVRIRFLLSDDSTTDVFVTSSSEDVVAPTGAVGISYVSLLVPSNAVFPAPVSAKAMLGFYLTKAYASGGGGGGAAFGANGSPGTAAYKHIWVDSGNSIDIYTGGNGGNGASAAAPSAPAYGCGGGGGNGGGGGGSGGGSNLIFSGVYDYYSAEYGDRGTGGSGSAGGAGGAGVCLIYY